MNYCHFGCLIFFPKLKTRWHCLWLVNHRYWMEPNGRDKLSTTWRWMDQKENVFYQNWFIVMKSKRFHSSVFYFWLLWWWWWWKIYLHWQLVCFSVIFFFWMYSTTITISQWKTFFVGKEILHKMMKIALLYFILFCRSF